MSKKTELQKLDNQIAIARKNHVSDLEDKRYKLREEISKENYVKLVGKTFAYRDNSFGCGSKKSDNWDVFLKVVSLSDGGIKTLSVEKDSHGNIQIQTADRYGGNLMGYVPCSMSEFNRNYKRLQKQLNDAYEKEGEQ